MSQLQQWALNVQVTMAGEMETAAGVMLLPLKQLSLHVTFTQSEKEKRKKKPGKKKTEKKILLREKERGENICMRGKKCYPWAFFHFQKKKKKITFRA